jgi:short subunit dehydrogenase-like uncharacterized protein
LNYARAAGDEHPDKRRHSTKLFPWHADLPDSSVDGMAPRIVVFGATGFTGRITVQALVDAGQRPVVAGRSESSVKQLAADHGLDHAVADVDRPQTVRALVRPGDVLISLVGPFTRWGRPAVEAAIDAGAHYIDSTGEPPFIRDVYERYSPGARAANCALLTAMGYDYVPGNLAAGLALKDAGEDATHVRVGYFVTGRLTGSALSGGTRASLMGVMDDGFARRDGILVRERPGVRFKEFSVAGRKRAGISLGASEHFAVPQSFPQVATVEAYLGWFGPASRGVSLLARTGGAVMGLAPVKRLVEARVKGSSGGPDAEARSGTRTLAVAEALAPNGRQLGRAVVQGVNPYDFTGRMLSWTARRIAEHGTLDVGAQGPIGAFGLDVLTDGVREAGVERIE